MAAKILVIDDTLALVDLLRDVLGAEGHEVSTCLLARESYSMARRIRPNLIILDIVMPEVSGWDVLEQLRRDNALSAVPIIICTAWAEQAAARMQQLREPDLWLLPKPFEMPDLLDTVVEALESTPPPLRDSRQETNGQLRPLDTRPLDWERHAEPGRRAHEGEPERADSS